MTNVLLVILVYSQDPQLGMYSGGLLVVWWIINVICWVYDNAFSAQIKKTLGK